MKMAKASKGDIEKMINFFSLWKIMEDANWMIDSSDYTDYTEEIFENLSPYFIEKFKDSWGDVDIEKIKITFFNNWKDEIDCCWRRVVFGCDILIDNCCNPNKDFLELHPKFNK